MLTKQCAQNKILA